MRSLNLNYIHNCVAYLAQINNYIYKTSEINICHFGVFADFLSSVKLLLAIQRWVINLSKRHLLTTTGEKASQQWTIQEILPIS
jgi:hypothetical protein